MNFAKKYKNEGITFWENIIFTVESKFKIFGVKKSPKICQSVNEEFNDICVTKTVNHGGGSIMVWGCIAASKIGNLAFIGLSVEEED